MSITPLPIANDSAKITLLEIFERTFKVKNIKTKNLQYEKILNWDSLAHMQLIGKIETKFKVKIKEVDVAKITSYDKALTIINKNE